MSSKEKPEVVKQMKYKSTSKKSPEKNTDDRKDIKKISTRNTSLSTKSKSEICLNPNSTLKLVTKNIGSMDEEEKVKRCNSSGSKTSTAVLKFGSDDNSLVSENSSSGSESDDDLASGDDPVALTTEGDLYDNVFEAVNAARTNASIKMLPKSLMKKEPRQVKTSASSSASSGSSFSVALPPISYDELNQSRPIMESATFFDPFFGEREMERYFPNHELRLAVISWNMSSKAPSNYNQALQQILKLKTNDMLLNETGNDGDAFNAFNDSNENLPEMFVIGLQETPRSDVINNIKVGIQAVLGPNYVLFNWSNVGTLSCSIWLRRELLWSCTVVETTPVHLRAVAANRIRTKGALALSFNLFGTSFLFINTHLSAHAANLSTRINQFNKIVHALKINSNEAFEFFDLPVGEHSVENDKKTAEIAQEKYSIDLPIENKKSKKKEVEKKLLLETEQKETDQPEHIFWFGDLNFRLELPIDSVLNQMRAIANAKNEQEKLEIQMKLMKSDQLSNLMSRGLIFKNFREAVSPPPFFPTYKCRYNTKEVINFQGLNTSHQNLPHKQNKIKTNKTKKITRPTSTETNTSSSPSQTSTSSFGKSNEIDNNNNNEGAQLVTQTASSVSTPKTKSSREDLINVYNFDANRVPSYTDRILYQSRTEDDVNDPPILCKHYDSIGDITSSDHKPVYALFQVKLNSGGPRRPSRMKKLMGIDKKNVTKNKKALSNPKSYNLLNALKGNNSLKNSQNLKETAITSNLQKVAQSAISASLSSLNSVGTHNSNYNSNIGKLTSLNAGNFNRQVYIDGLRLRNTMLQGITIKQIKQRHNTLTKSHSLDSKISEHSLAHSSGLPISPLVTSSEFRQASGNQAVFAIDPEISENKGISSICVIS